jgi:hypothetical protein
MNADVFETPDGHTSQEKAKVRYAILKSKDPDALVDKVNDGLGRGWKLHGDTHFSRESGLFVQAITLEP